MQGQVISMDNLKLWLGGLYIENQLLQKERDMLIAELEQIKRELEENTGFHEQGKEQKTKRIKSNG